VEEIMEIKKDTMVFCKKNKKVGKFVGYADESKEKCFIDFSSSGDNRELYCIFVKELKIEPTREETNRLVKTYNTMKI
jgi:hypothetical protein